MIYFLLYIWVFYLAFCLYAGCQNAIAEKAWGVLIPTLPVVVVGLILDVMFNFTFGRLLFWEWAYTTTFSERLILHFTDTGWRGSVARDIGNVLDHILPHHIK
jgi:hypothetical protein